MSDKGDKDLAVAPTMMDPATPPPPDEPRTAEATPSEDGRVADEATLERIGEVIADKYRLVDVIGSGGMGTVYAAEHVELPKRYALKLLRPDRVGSPSAVRRFRREAIEAAATNHPGIVEIIDCGQTADGSVYSVMELLDGFSVHALLERGPLPVGKAVDIAVGALDALEAAHARGLIHRDIKPENLVVLRDGRVKVLDFGIAKIGSDDARLTQDGHILGTPTYMSLEQLRESSRVDARADVYSLGATLYEMLTGHPPVLGRSLHDVMAKIISDKVHRDPRDGRPAVPDALAEIVKRALGRHPEERFASAREMREALLALPDDIVDDESLDLPASRRASRSQEMEGPGSTASLDPPHTLAEDVSRAATIDMSTSVPPEVSVRYDTRSDPPEGERSLPPSQIRSLRARPGRARLAGAAASVLVVVALGWWWTRDEGAQPDTVASAEPVPSAEPAPSSTGPQPPADMIAFEAGDVTLGSSASEIERATSACRAAPYPAWLVGGEDPCRFIAREHPERRARVAAFAIDRDEVDNERFAEWLAGLSELSLADASAHGHQRGRLVMHQGHPLLKIDDNMAGIAFDGRYAAIPGREHMPANYVTWYGAQAYCVAQGRRLPSEAEWALAARGREGRRFPWGDAEPSCDEQVFGRAPELACARSSEGPAAIGAAGDVTAQGVRGLGGNVREWVADVFEADRRIVRGGGWLDQPAMLRAARRGSDDPSWADPAIGFRCAQ